MDLQRLRVFREVARAKSFTRAAENLHLSQPAVSKHIRMLEAELGVRLLERAGKQATLTEAGRIVDDYARRVFVLGEDVRRALHELQGLQRGYLRLGASSTPGLYLLPPLVAAFGRTYPGVEVTLDLSNSLEIAGRVARRELDLGFVGTLLETSGLQVQPVTSDEIVLIVPAGHESVAGPQPLSALLQTETLIVREPGSGTRTVVEAALAALGLRPTRTMTLRGCEAVKRAVAAGLGVSFVSRLAVSLEVSQGMLQVAELQEPSIQRQLYVVSRKDLRASVAALAFLALLRKGVQTRAGSSGAGGLGSAERSG